MARVPLMPEEPARGPDDTGPVRHLNRSELAAELGMKSGALEKALMRHPEGSQPDVQVGPGGPGTTFGWLPSRVRQMMAWRDSLPQQGRLPGSGGRRPYAGDDAAFAEALAEAERIIAAEPHATNAEIASRAGVSESTVIRAKRRLAG